MFTSIYVFVCIIHCAVYKHIVCEANENIFGGRVSNLKKYKKKTTYEA